MTDPERPNLVLVSIDSLRADHCGYVPGSETVTPTLAAMAREGLSADLAIAPGPSTPESMPVVFTGEYPLERPGEDATDLSTYQSRLRRHMVARRTIPERLSELGYTTAAFTPNPFTSRHFGFDGGFDHFQDFMTEGRDGDGLYDRIFSGFLEGNAVSSFARVLWNFWQGEEVFKPWESFYDEAIEWTRNADEPYFLWVFLMDAHNPYLASSEYRTQSRPKQFHANFRFWWESHETPFSAKVHERLMTAYRDSVRYSDAFLERLRDDLVADDPAIVVHGDHGEAFGEHGTYGHEPYLHPENVHVPLVVDGVPERSVTSPVSLRSIPDLLASLATDRDWNPTERVAVTTRTVQGDATAVYAGLDRYGIIESTDDVTASADDVIGSADGVAGSVDGVTGSTEGATGSVASVADSVERSDAELAAILAPFAERLNRTQREKAAIADGVEGLSDS